MDWAREHQQWWWCSAPSNYTHSQKILGFRQNFQSLKDKGCVLFRQEKKCFLATDDRLHRIKHVKFKRKNWIYEAVQYVIKVDDNKTKKSLHNKRDCLGLKDKSPMICPSLIQKCQTLLIGPKILCQMCKIKWKINCFDLRNNFMITSYKNQ